jgi:hypothetical protein
MPKVATPPLKQASAMAVVYEKVLRLSFIVASPLQRAIWAETASPIVPAMAKVI